MFDEDNRNKKEKNTHEGLLNKTTHTFPFFTENQNDVTLSTEFKTIKDIYFS